MELSTFTWCNCCEYHNPLQLLLYEEISVFKRIDHCYDTVDHGFSVLLDNQVIQTGTGSFETGNRHIVSRRNV